MATKFDAEFIERRMEEHRRWQHAVLYALIEEVIDEVQALPPRKPKSGRLFDEIPELLGEEKANGADSTPRRNLKTVFAQTA